MPAKMTVTGGPETAAAFDRLADDLGNMGPAHDAIARARLPGVARRTPVRSGALAGSWDAQGSPDGGSIVSALDYAGPMEYGILARNIVGARMVAATLEAESAAVVAEYEAAIAERARARGFRIG